MQVATTAPQTHRRLLAICPDVAVVLAVVAVRKASLSSVQLQLDYNIIKVIQVEYLLRFYVSC
jgi:hypothetical protein